MTKHLIRAELRQIRKRQRRLKAAALLATGALVAVPAIAATIPDGHLEYVANLRLIEAARSIGEAGTNLTTWEGDSSWRIDAGSPDSPFREIRMTWPRDAVVLPFNLFSHEGDAGSHLVVHGIDDEGNPVTSIETDAVEGAGVYRIIVPGDYGSTTIRVHNDGPTAGLLTARLDRNQLHNVDRAQVTELDAAGRPVPGTLISDPAEDLAYDYLFINGQPARDFVGDSAARISFDGLSAIPIDAGSYVDLPFDWSFFAFADDAYYGERHNIGNRPYTRADFRLNLEISGNVTQLTIFKSLAGPLTDGDTAGLAALADSGDWHIEVFAVGHQNDVDGYAASPVFSGLYQTAAMAGPGAENRWATYGNINASPTFGLLVNPGNIGPSGAALPPVADPITGVPVAVAPALYTAVVLNTPAPAAGGADFLLDQAEKNREWIASSFGPGGSLNTAQITELERDEFGEAIGSLQCVLLGAFDAGGGRVLVDNGTGGWAQGPYGGRNGLVQVPENHHAVCEKVSQTSLVNVEKIVQSYGITAAGAIVPVVNPAVSPTDWEINITPVYVADGTVSRITTSGTLVTADAVNPVGAGIIDLNATQNALGPVAVPVGATQAFSSDVRIVPGQTYRVDLIAPEAHILAGFNLVDVYLTPLLPDAETLPLRTAGSLISLDTLRNRGNLAPNTGGVLASGRSVPLDAARIEPTWGSAFVPYGTTLAAGAPVPPAEGITASWILSFDQLTANTITFVSSNHPELQPQTPPPYTPPPLPGRDIPGRILTQTGTDLALGLLAAAVLAGGTWLLLASRRRKNSESAEA